MRFVTRHDGRPVAETEALKLSSLANKVTSVVRSDSSSVAIVKFATDFTATFEKEHAVFFLDALIVHIVEDMVSYNFLTGNSRLTYQRSVQIAMCFLQRPNILHIIVDIYGKGTGCRTFGISHLDDGTLFLGQRKDRFWYVPLASTLRTRTSTFRSTLRL